MTATKSRQPVVGPVALTGRIQPYAWGDVGFIPSLLGIADPQGPYAELWLGAHPDLPAIAAFNGAEVALDELVATQSSAILGEHVGRRFGKLPYLLKVLAAARPLSIQVHPNRQQAEQGYARERVAGFAGARSYRDEGHKPELLVALTPVHALAGFRPFPQLLQALHALPELTELLPEFDGSGRSLRRVLAAYFSLPDDMLLRAHQQLIARLECEVSELHLDERDPRTWALLAHRELGHAERPDRGLLFVFLLNLVELAPSEALFLPAGMPHAYLRGAGVELMASSDNVLRCGLTPKHVDADEMLRILDYRGVVPPVLRPRMESGQQAYATPAEEFELHTISIRGGKELSLATRGPELLLAIGAGDGALVDVREGQASLQLERGQGCLLPAGHKFCVLGQQVGILCRVSVPSSGATLFRGTRPQTLAFGTSGLRGLVSDITDLEAYINTRGFLDYATAMGDIAPGGTVALAGDLRPSTDSPERSILRAVTRAVTDSGFVPLYLGRIPTPALTYYAVSQGMPSVMVTGSHIPFDRNGIKFNRSHGEVLKSDEAGILTCVARIREQTYAVPATESPFDAAGMLHEGQSPVLPAVSVAAADLYRQRYLSGFPADALLGLRVVLYEHSAVGRELLADILRSLGAEVVPMGRVAGFVAIDTEALSPETLPLLQRMVDDAAAKVGPIDAVVSTDGDSDRPLLLGVNALGKLEFVSGDVLGLIVAEYLGADAVAVPVSASDVIEQRLTPKGTRVMRTRIGSPHVIAAMEQLDGDVVAGWEANGGFLLGSTVRVSVGTLSPLPTRDAVLPICAVLHEAKRSGLGVCGLRRRLPHRYTAAGLLDAVPTEASFGLLALLGAETLDAREVRFVGDRVLVGNGHSNAQPASHELYSKFMRARVLIESCFSKTEGFGRLARMDLTDGVRMFFDGGDIAHLRPSGNAPQLRIYAVADSETRAHHIVDLGLDEPDGILRRLLQAAAEEAFVAAVTKNIELTEALFASGRPASVIGTVSGSAAAQAFWQALLDRSRQSFRARAAISFHEDLPVNQAFGLLLLWQRLRPQLQAGEGALVAFVFGEGSRATPYTETDNGQKPAILSYVQTKKDAGGGRYLSMVELALRYFAPVESYLRRSGFDGLVVKWGDEVQIPICDLSGSDSRFAEADVVRFVSMRPMTDADAENKDWVGVNRAGVVTAFIPRRPLAEMELLAGRGLVEKRGATLWGGVNLGSIAVSRRLLDGLLEEFATDVNDPTADRKKRPDLDPQFFTALTIATIDDDAARNAAYATACAESSVMHKMAVNTPDLLGRLRSVLATLAERDGRPVRIMALDFVDQYWGDIGQHPQMYDFYMALADAGSRGRIARRLAGLAERRDEHGNMVVGRCQLPKDASVNNSVLIDVVIDDVADIEDSVLIGTRAKRVVMRKAFDILGVMPELELPERAGSYRVVSREGIWCAPGERLTTLFFYDGPLLFRVHEDVDLRDRKANYDNPVCGNPLSFACVHQLMCEAGPEQVQERRATERRLVLRKFQEGRQ